MMKWIKRIKKVPFFATLILAVVIFVALYIRSIENAQIPPTVPSVQVGTSTPVQSPTSTTPSKPVDTTASQGASPSPQPTKPATTTTSTSPKPQTPPPGAGRGVGFAEGGALIGLSNAALAERLDEIAAVGGTWLRIDIEWGHVQYNSPDVSDWSKYDRVINAALARNIKVLGIITYTPRWARAEGCRGGVACPPRDPATFAKFASQVVSRYKAKGVHHWEVWNEPNSYDFWATKADCEAYTRLLKVTYPAIKQADPSATVIAGGLAPAATNDVNISPIDFLSCIYKNGGKGSFDAVAHHPYSFPNTPTDAIGGAWAQMSQTPTSLRSIMVMNGDADKKIWMTEFGAPTNGPDPKWFVTEAKQAQIMEDALRLHSSYAWAGPFFIYSFKDSGVSKSTNESFFGIVRNDGSRKPAYDAVKKILGR